METWRFLLCKFKPSVWWWGIALLFKGLFLNLGMVFFKYGGEQVFWIFAVILVYSGGLIAAWPWRHSVCNLLDLVTQGMLLSVCMLSTWFAERRDWMVEGILTGILSISFIPCLAFGAAALVLIRRGCQATHTREKNIDAAGLHLQDTFRRLADLSREELAECLHLLSDHDWVVLEQAQMVIFAEFLGHHQEVLGRSGEKVRQQRCSTMSGRKQRDSASSMAASIIGSDSLTPAAENSVGNPGMEAHSEASGAQASAGVPEAACQCQELPQAYQVQEAPAGWQNWHQWHAAWQQWHLHNYQMAAAHAAAAPSDRSAWSLYSGISWPQGGFSPMQRGNASQNDGAAEHKQPQHS